MTGQTLNTITMTGGGKVGGGQQKVELKPGRADCCWVDLLLLLVLLHLLLAAGGVCVFVLLLLDFWAVSAGSVGVEEIALAGVWRSVEVVRHSSLFYRSWLVSVAQASGWICASGFLFDIAVGLFFNNKIVNISWEQDKSFIIALYS